jgi:hypothetical protein
MYIYIYIYIYVKIFPGGPGIEGDTRVRVIINPGIYEYTCTCIYKNTCYVCMFENMYISTYIHTCI